MADPLESSAYTNWISHVFPNSRYRTLGVVSALAAGGVFALGYGITALGGGDYLCKRYPYVGAGGIFWILLWLGWVDAVQVSVWNRVYPAFGVDSATYRDVIGSQLDSFYNDRVTLGYSASLVVLYLACVVLFHVSAFPGDGRISMIFDSYLGGDSLVRAANFVLFGTVLIPALVTSVRGFVNHVLLLRRVKKLPFQNLSTAAQQLEPLAKFSLTPATAWFAGVSLILLGGRGEVSDPIAQVVIATLVLITVVHIAVPLLTLHDALQDAQRELLAEIRADYDEIRHSVRTGDESPDRLSLWLEVTDRRQQNANAISTWVYDLSSLRRFLVAAAIPLLTLIDEVLSLLSAL